MVTEEGIEPRRRLQIIVAPDCPGCEEAHLLAQEVQERFPTLRVELIDVDGPHPVPPGVVATPTYVLDGRIISLGNPYRATLMAAILDARQERDLPTGAPSEVQEPAQHGSVLVGPPDRELTARLDTMLQEHAPGLAVSPPSGAAPGNWRRQSLFAGIAGSVLASFCCLPMATAIALGLGLGTVATLSQLLVYQRLFQAAGLALAGVAAWWLVRRSQASCSLSARERERVPLLVFGAFAASFVILNLVVIPVLEHIPGILGDH